jgi:hypothetical protein
MADAAECKTRRRWFRLTPGCFVLGLLAVEGFLLLSEHFQWLANAGVRNSSRHCRTATLSTDVTDPVPQSRHFRPSENRVSRSKKIGPPR